MPKFSKRSLTELDSCHVVLQRLLRRVIERSDFTVICGFRNQEAQERAYRAGASKLQFPHSKHNTSPSMAADIVPFPIDWDDTMRFRELATVVKSCWAEMTAEEQLRYELVWGGDWATFRDLPHFELRFAEGLNPPKL